MSDESITQEILEAGAELAVGGVGAALGEEVAEELFGDDELGDIAGAIIGGSVGAALADEAIDAMMD